MSIKNSYICQIKMVQMFSCTRANLKYDTNTSRRIGRVYVLRSDFAEQIRFQEKRRSFHTLLQLFRSIDASLGSLSNDEGAVNKNVTKATGLDWQNNNCARATHVFVPFFSLPSLHDYDVKLPISRFLRDVNTEQQLSIYFPEYQFNSRKNCQHLTK